MNECVICNQASDELDDAGECPGCAADWQDDDSDSPIHDPGSIHHDH